MPPAHPRRCWWGICACYTLVLYATLPLGRPVITWARVHCTPAQQQTCTWAVFAAVALALAVYLVSLRRVVRPMAYVCALVLARVYWYELTLLTHYPEERFHFIEYGVLAVLLYGAWRQQVGTGWAYLGAAVTGVLIGAGDEGVQYLTKYIPVLARGLGCTLSNPEMFRRYFGWSDIWLNVLGVLYGLVFWLTVVQNRRATAP